MGCGLISNSKQTPDSESWSELRSGAQSSLNAMSGSGPFSVTHLRLWPKYCLVQFIGVCPWACSRFLSVVCARLLGDLGVCWYSHGVPGIPGILGVCSGLCGGMSLDCCPGLPGTCDVVGDPWFSESLWVREVIRDLGFLGVWGVLGLLEWIWSSLSPEFSSAERL